MPQNILPERGDIWLADLDPTRGREQAGRRPVLIVSVGAFNESKAGLVVVIPLTSTARGIPWHVAVVPPDGGLKNTRISCAKPSAASAGNACSSAGARYLWRFARKSRIGCVSCWACRGASRQQAARYFRGLIASVGLMPADRQDAGQNGQDARAPRIQLNPAAARRVGGVGAPPRKPWTIGRIPCKFTLPLFPGRFPARAGFTFLP